MGPHGKTTRPHQAQIFNSVTMRSKFKDEHPFEKRKAEAERIRQKYSDHIPVICEKVEKSDIDEVLPPTAALMSSIYEEHKDEDGFLYISYSGENTFGRDASVLEID